MKYKKPIDVDFLNECLSYSPSTGIFVWKVRPRKHFKRDRAHSQWNARMSGKIAGRGHIAGYLDIQVSGERYLLHRVAWAFCNGVRAISLEVDHVNGNKQDNRIDNLRLVTPKDNQRNARMPKTNKSGCVGVYFDSACKKWRSQIAVNYGCIYLGSFSDWFEAVCARKSAENKMGFHRNHGRLE